ncbi:MAG: hypothetical protein LBP37_04340 [Spirochaetaceae bacterium]|nr:hypothetical protein [Spirochaetaceae bacterium]
MVQAAAAQAAVYIIISGYGLEVRVLGMKPDYFFHGVLSPYGRVTGLFILEDGDMRHETKIARHTKNSQPVLPVWAALPTSSGRGTIMKEQDIMIQKLNTFLSAFKSLNNSHNEDETVYREMEKVIGEFSFFILNKRNSALWDSMECQNNTALNILAEQLREQSAFCVWSLEKYRALEFQKNKQGIADYFRNIEVCIETEFGSFEITGDSKVLMIGVGAFPMTPLLIVQKTGAEVVGIDIDSRAIDLARTLIHRLNKNTRIAIKGCTVDQLEFTKKVTHIIFASTVKEKFDILKQLHPLTNQDVVVAMRYGNGFKSLFNYPLEDIGSSDWKIVNNVSLEENIFDIALYKKVNNERNGEI